VATHLQVKGRVKMIQRHLCGRKRYPVVSTNGAPAKPPASTEGAVSLDVRIVDFVVTSDGRRNDNPRWGREGSPRWLERA
jgi:transposase